MKNRPHLEILAPVNTLEEVARLVDAGADCLYGGCLPSSWQERYPSTVLLNQRTFSSAQFSSLRDLEAAVAAARVAGKGFALTLNAPFYMDEQLPMVMELVRAAGQMGVTALIVADQGLIRALDREENRIPIHLSTMGLATNPAAAGFYQSLGVARIILPRFLTTADIAEINRHYPELELEAFILVGKCPNIEGVCSFLHDDPDLRWPCEWEYAIDEDDGGGMLRHYLNGLQAADRREACGLCALPLLRAAGVGTCKIVGRGAPTDRKVLYIRSLRDLATRMPDGMDPAWIQQCREVYAELYGHPCGEGNCYYPEVRGT